MLQTIMQNIVPFWSYISLNLKEDCFLTQKWHLTYASLKTKPQKDPVWKFAHVSINLQGIQYLKP